MQSILIVGIIIFAGFIFGQIAKYLRLPKVTGYIIAGIFLNPGITNIIPKDFILHTSLITNLSLSIITFSVGGTLLYQNIKKLGKGILFITFFEAEFAFFAVIIGFLLIGPHFINAPFLTTIVPLSILLGCLGSPTDPTATLAVRDEYQAKGEVSDTIMGVAAFDDALGIMNYSLAIAIASIFVLNQPFNTNSSILNPIIIILSSILLGILVAIVFNLITKLFLKSESGGVFIVLTVGLLCLCFGIASYYKLDPLLSTMTMGAVVVNFNNKREIIFQALENYCEELVFVLFFTLSGMFLDFSVLGSSILLMIFFIFLRTIGKVSGTQLGAHLSKSSDKIKKYVAFGLIPQGGIVIGLALMIAHNPAFDSISKIIISVIIGATVFHELVGPICVKLSLKAAGEIK
ncbi:MAG: cation:proton antiporter [Candidatus Saganbacteria bacterium]|nr:cation:proton antiporter [Candidatus Saganbacteria bacterium]